MKRNIKIIIIVACATIVVGAAIFISVRKDGNNNNINSAQTELPVTVFDGVTKIPNTKISVSYPTKGFYGLGAKFLPYNMDNNLYDVTGGAGIVTSSPADTSKISEQISITLDVRKADNNNLESLIKKLNDNNGPEYAPNGVTETVADNIFYIAKNKSGDQVYFDAYTLKNNQYIHIKFQFSEGMGSINKAASDNNEKLFYDYLNNLNIKEN
jgi:hypothetical protein